MADEVYFKKVIPAFRFKVDFLSENGNTADFPSVDFSDVSGIGIELQTEDIMEGGVNNEVIRLPKPPKYKNLVLKHALSSDPPGTKTLIEWALNAVQNFDFKPLTVAVSLIDSNDTALKTWNFTGAYPVKLSITDLSASKNEVIIETLELAYRRFKLM